MRLILLLAVCSCSKPQINYVLTDCCPVNVCEKGRTVGDLEAGFACQAEVIRQCRCR